MLDLEMLLTEKKSVAASFTTDAYDFKQENPNSGSYNTPLVMVIKIATAGTGSGTVTLAVQDSADGSSFASVVSIAALAGTDLVAGKDIVIPMPIEHRRYVRLSGTVSGTLTGAVTAYLSNTYQQLPTYTKEGIDILPTID